MSHHAFGSRQAGRAPGSDRPARRRRSWAPSPIAWALLALAGVLVVLTVGQPGYAQVSQAAGNLLAGKSPLDSSGATRPGRITDGTGAVEGDAWQTNLTSGLASPSAHVDWDLGAPTHICCATVQADANDRYALSVSDDGRTWTHLWEAPPIRGSGMLTRDTDTLDATARYVRLSANGGDGHYSVAEVQVFSQRPEGWPARPPAERGKVSTEELHTRMQLFGVAAVAYVLLRRRRAPAWMNVAGLVPLGLGAWLAMQIAELWPLEEREQTLLRAVVAAIAGAMLLADHFLIAKEEERDKRFTTAVLAACAVLAVASYYHLGMPQFRDEAKDRPTLVHPWDMRVYFPIAKYFDELRFDGLYLASVAAYIDNNPDVTPASVGGVRLRDLTNNQVTDARDVMDQIQSVRTRFTPERWELFRKDMKYFQDLMGRGGYLGSLRDHGGNATPVWLLGAWMLFHRAPANELTLSLAALLDPLLLGVMFYAIARSFGLRASLVTMIIWGTTDLSRFGTNLMGSTLRMDWMVAVGLGACALKSKRWWLGGALFAYAGLIRGFPGMSAVFLLVPPLWYVVDGWRQNRKLPSIADFKRDQKPFLVASVGVVACVVGLVGVSSGLFGADASWGNWIRKISIHQEKPNVNHVGLRTIMSFEPDKTGDKVLRKELPEPWTDWQHYQLAALQRRKPLYYGVIALMLAAAAVAVRNKRLDQAGIIGMFLIPFAFYPANYYCHFVFLLPLAAARKRDETNKLFGWLAVVSMAMTVALYFTLTERQVDVLFTQQSWVLLIGLVAMMAPLAWFAWKEPAPALAPDLAPSSGTWLLPSKLAAASAPGEAAHPAAAPAKPEDEPGGKALEANAQDTQANQERS